MNKQPVRGVEADAPGDEAIAEHLLANPDFFERHSSVLARLKLPHQRGSAAISLVERQVLVLREKHGALERKLQELIENGRANDAIVDRCHRLTRRLLRARDLAGTSVALDTSLREDFGASRWLILLTSPDVPRIASCRTHTFASSRAAAPSSGSSRRSSTMRARAAARSATPSASTCSTPRKAPWARWS